MRCDEIQERFVDLLYNERGTPPASPELRAHIDSCPVCRKELDGLRKVRTDLKMWEDEPLPAPVVIPTAARSRRAPGFVLWPVLRYAGVAALLAVAFLALSNAEITWNKQGFSFHAHGFTARPTDDDYYTKAEVRNILKRVLDDSESRMTELNYQMIQQMRDTVEQEHLQELRYVRDRITRERSKN